MQDLGPGAKNLMLSDPVRKSKDITYVSKNFHRLYIKMDLLCLWELVWQGWWLACNWLNMMALGTFRERKAAELEDGMKMICCHQCRQHLRSPEGLGEYRSKERESSPSPFPSSQTGTSIVLAKGRLSSGSKVFIHKMPLVPSFPPHSSQAFGLSQAITQISLVPRPLNSDSIRAWIFMVI